MSSLLLCMWTSFDDTSTLFYYIHFVCHEPSISSGESFTSSFLQCIERVYSPPRSQPRDRKVLGVETTSQTMTRT